MQHPAFLAVAVFSQFNADIAGNWDLLSGLRWAVAGCIRFATLPVRTPVQK
jgi:hypothetical protein